MCPRYEGAGPASLRIIRIPFRGSIRAKANRYAIGEFSLRTLRTSREYMTRGGRRNVRRHLRPILLGELR